MKADNTLERGSRFQEFDHRHPSEAESDGPDALRIYSRMYFENIKSPYDTFTKQGPVLEKGRHKGCRFSVIMSDFSLAVNICRKPDIAQGSQLGGFLPCEIVLSSPGMRDNDCWDPLLTGRVIKNLAKAFRAAGEVRNFLFYHKRLILTFF
jgi:hypothetical protein